MGSRGEALVMSSQGVPWLNGHLNDFKDSQLEAERVCRWAAARRRGTAAGAAAAVAPAVRDSGFGGGGHLLIWEAPGLLTPCLALGPPSAGRHR